MEACAPIARSTPLDVEHLHPFHVAEAAAIHDRLTAPEASIIIAVAIPEYCSSSGNHRHYSRLVVDVALVSRFRKKPSVAGDDTPVHHREQATEKSENLAHSHIRSLEKL